MSVESKSHVQVKDASNIHVIYLIVGSLLSFVLSMGLARFAYTLVLPLMQRQVAFDNEVAGWLASANLAGYFLGSVGASAVSSRVRPILTMRLGIVACIISIAGKGLTESLLWWGALQFLGGIGGAVVLIFCTALAFDQLAAQGKAHYAGFVYSGVGLGIALSALVVLIIGTTITASQAWLSLGVLGLFVAIPTWLWVRESPTTPEPSRLSPSAPSPVPSLLWWISLSYFIAAVGYIITATYLVKIVERATGSLAVGSVTWLITGVAGTFATMAWPYVAKRFGYVTTIITAQVGMALGIILPVFSSSIAAAYLSALLFGGTFVGSFVLHLAFGKSIVTGQNSAKILGLLTAAFSVGQAIGPLIGGRLAEAYGSFDPALLVAMGFALIAPVVLLIGTNVRRSERVVLVKP